MLGLVTMRCISGCCRYVVLLWYFVVDAARTVLQAPPRAAIPACWRVFLRSVCRACSSGLLSKTYCRVGYYWRYLCSRMACILPNNVVG